MLTNNCRINAKQNFLLGANILLLGIGFYLFFRTEPPYFLSLLKLYLPAFNPLRAPDFLQAFPSFVYVAGFCFLTMSFLKISNIHVIACSVFWLLVTVLYEFSCRSSVIVDIYSSFTGNTLYCVFDWNDVMAAFLGAVAFISISFVNTKKKTIQAEGVKTNEH